MISRSGFTFLLIIISLLFFYSYSMSQDTGGNKFTTQATDAHARPDAKKMGPREKKILFIIKNNPLGTLYGNPCFKQASNKFGFEYLVAPGGMAPNRNNFSRSLHNFGTNFILVLRNGPFWKVRMKKELQHCKYGYGDFVG